MKKFFQEFKEFISQGNIVDMAVGVVIGAAFKEIVNALVNNVIMPLVELATGGVSVDSWEWVLKKAAMVGEEVVTPAVAIQYGILLQAIIDFLIVAFCIFVVLKIMMSAQKKMQSLLHKKAEEEAAAVAEEAPAETEMDVLKDIRELLVKQSETK